MFLYSVSTLCLFACFASGSCGLRDFVGKIATEVKDGVISAGNVILNKYVIGNVPVTKTTPEIIKSDGYNVEIHSVTTSDGYILELHRIPGKIRPDGSQGPIALVQHGLFCDSAIYVILGPQKGLAYLLADRGYDVWMGNNRGSQYSRKHVNMSADAADGKYWQFSWHELGIHDLPAMIDFILSRTLKEDLIYIGHSQGTTQFFVMGSERPEYNKKIKAMYALSPIVYFRHAKTPIFVEPMNSLIHSVEKGPEVFNAESVLNRLTKNKCMSETYVNAFACAHSIYVSAGFDEEQTDMSLFPKIFSIFPTSSGMKQVMHYEQVFKFKKFQQFDFGVNENIQKYGSPNPPEYKLGNVTAPVTVYYGLNDYFCGVEDVDALYSELGNPKGKIPVPWHKFNHFDFLYAKDVKTLLYDDLMLKMDQVSGLR